MPPRSRTAKTSTAQADPEPEVVEEESARVTRLQSVDLDLDAAIEEEEAKHADAGPPTFTFTLGGQDWTVERPGVSETLDAEQAVFLTDFFRIIMGDELWEEFEPVFREVRVPSATWKLARGISQAFGMDPASVNAAIEADERAGGNRPQRRAGRRPQPRRR